MTIHISFYATTTGTGPFYPAVRCGGALWIFPIEFQSETRAAALAQATVAALQRKIQSELTARGFAMKETP